MTTFAVLFLMLIVILIAAEVFTNALEHLGEKLKISEGVTGSLFAAVGTALPETMVPLLALMAGTSNVNVNEEIGVGAILGAPLMLSTLSISLMALAVLKKRGAHGHFMPERTGLTRDLNFFLAAFALSCVALFVPHETGGIRAVIAESFERIHRSNLVGMGILPLQFNEGDDAKSLGLTGREVFDIDGLGDGSAKSVAVKATGEDGAVKTFAARVRIDTPQEVEYYRHGGILQYVLRQLAG